MAISVRGAWWRERGGYSQPDFSLGWVDLPSRCGAQLAPVGMSDEFAPVGAETLGTDPVVGTPSRCVPSLAWMKLQVTPGSDM